MKRFLPFLLLILFSACAKDENITFRAVVESVQEQGVTVRTVDYGGFDRAYVFFSENLKPDFKLAEGRTVDITILPEIRESDPVQVTAVKIRLAE